MLRQEVYALDGTDAAAHPYTVSEQNFTVRRLQPPAAQSARRVLPPPARDGDRYDERTSTERGAPPIRASPTR